MSRKPQIFRGWSVAILSMAFVAGASAQVAPFIRIQKPTATQEILQTKEQKFVPADGKGPAIWLVGVAHVAQAGYYRDLQKLLDKQDCVLYEGVSRNGVDPAKAADVGGKDLRQKSTYQMLSDSLGLQFQLYGIDYSKPTFHNSDLSWEELSAIEAKHPGANAGMSLGTLGNMLNADSPQAKQMATVLSQIKDDPSSVEAMHLVMIDTLSDPDVIKEGLSASLSDLLIQKRNAKVLSELKKELDSKQAPKSIAIFFGAAHMPDMEKHLLEDFHYKPADEQWMTAIQGDSAMVTSPNGKMLLSMVRAQIKAMKDKKDKGGG